MLNLLNNKKEILIFAIVILSIFIFNIIYEYQKYRDLTQEEIYLDNYVVQNIYDKKDYIILKVKNDKTILYTSISKEKNIRKLDNVKIAIISSKVTFIEFLKGFYAKSIYIEKLEQNGSLRKSIYKEIENMHKESILKELFGALFLAIPISTKNRVIYSNYSISHLIAISGFHLGIITFLSYIILNPIYKVFHSNFFIYRNKKFDILILSSIILLFYLVLTGFVPSLLRAFVMYILGIIFLRSNIKLISFKSLLIAVLLIISFFPTYIFSISLWFSVCGVFYIFLYLKYFDSLPKLLSFALFNFWIFFVFNPIVHYFFYNTSYEQLLSPIITIIFTIFYPLELFLHFIGQGDFLDKYLLVLLNYKIISYDMITPLWFFIIYIASSFLSIVYKYAFIFLNMLLVGFNIYLYVVV